VQDIGIWEKRKTTLNKKPQKGQRRTDVGSTLNATVA
jgi:hypothetical protein